LLDADEVVHELYSVGGAAVAPVAAAFPSAVSGGAVSRPALSACVVGNDAAMAQLEAIVHPLVAQRRRDFLENSMSEGHTLVVLDIPLLYETKSEGAVDAVAVASAGGDAQRARVLARPGMTEEKFMAILARQVPDEEKRRRADYVIDTSASLQETEAQVDALVASLRGKQGQVYSGLL